VWGAQREIALLRTQLDSERLALETFQRRLAQRTAYEQSHSVPTQLPGLRQATAAVHARVLDLERRLLAAQVQLRVLRNQDGGSVQPWSANR